LTHSCIRSDALEGRCANGGAGRVRVDIRGWYGRDAVQAGRPAVRLTDFLARSFTRITNWSPW
jgi:hypothetical protein